MHLYKKIYFLIGIFILISKSSAFCKDFYENDIFIEKANQYYQQNRLDQAIELYLQILKNNPSNLNALINIGAAFIKKGSYLEAYPYVKKLIKKFPNRAEGWINLAICEIGLGRLDEALKHLNTAEKKLDCPISTIWLHKGIIFSKLGKLDKALECYKKAEEFEPDNPVLVFNMALLYEKKKNYKDALLYYQIYMKQTYKVLSSEEKNSIQEKIYFLQNHIR